MNETYECPDCCADITLPDNEIQIRGQKCCQCPECGSQFIVDNDAEYIDGRWINRTKLYPAS